MENKFFLKNNIEKIERGEHSFFLDPKDLKYVREILDHQKISYHIYVPYPLAEKKLIYKDKLPKMKLFMIESVNSLSHRAILGTLFAHQIHPYCYSDIMISDKAYLIVLGSVTDYLKHHLISIGNEDVTLVEKDLDIVKDFTPKFETITLHVSSLRLDNILSKLLHLSRKDVEDKFNAKEVLYNYDIANKKNILLNDGDVFSVRKYGKYRFKRIVFQNRKGNYDIEIDKYQ